MYFGSNENNHPLALTEAHLDLSSRPLVNDLPLKAILSPTLPLQFAVHPGPSVLHTSLSPIKLPSGEMMKTLQTMPSWSPTTNVLSTLYNCYGTLNLKPWLSGNPSLPSRSALSPTWAHYHEIHDSTVGWQITGDKP